MKIQIIIVIAFVTIIGMMVSSAFAETIVDGLSVITTDKLDVVLVFVTDNKICSDNQLKQLNIYEQITENYLKKYLDFDTLNISTLCADVGDITRSTFPLILMQLGISNPDLLILVGDVVVNEELVIHDEAEGVWACTSWDEKLIECNSNLIVVCNDCERYPLKFETGAWALSHELAHFYFLNNDSPRSDGVHLLQYVYDRCMVTELDVCDGMDFIQIIDGQSFLLMDINYILNHFNYLKKTDISNFKNQESSKIKCYGGTMEKNGQCVEIHFPINTISPTEKIVVEEKSSRGGGCLIATATYGSEMATEVQQLRELRDNTLMNARSGVQFMGMFNDVYYSFSPTIADYERENPIFKEMVKVAITPMISSLSILNYVNMNSESEVLGYGISLILLNLGMYLGVPVVVIVGIRKKF